MSRFGDLMSGSDSAPTPPVPEPTPTPVVEETPAVIPGIEVTETPGLLPEQPDLSSLSKKQLEDYGRTVGIELDRRHSKSKLLRELKEHIDNP